MKYREINTQNIISKSKLPDADFVINPYIGCQHGCIYCYADFMKRFTGHINEKWGEFVDIKVNSDSTIKKANYKGGTIVIGSVTDPYQQIEKKYEITRKILSELCVIQPEIEILTKSSLIIRDIDILSKFKNLKVGVSLNTLDTSVSKKIEPFASTPKARIKVLQTLKNVNIKSYLFISPIFPFITDYKIIINELKDFVDTVYFENLNIRANNKSNILNFIHKNYPSLLGFYQTLSSNNHYWDSLQDEIIDYCNKKNISFRVYFNHANNKK